MTLIQQPLTPPGNDMSQRQCSVLATPGGGVDISLYLHNCVDMGQFRVDTEGFIVYHRLHLANTVYCHISPLWDLLLNILQGCYLKFMMVVRWRLQMNLQFVLE